MRMFVLLLVSIALAGLARAESPYISRSVLGFTVRALPDCFAGGTPDEVQDFEAKLEAQIAQIRRTLPAEKLARLLRIPIYVHHGEHHPFGCQHHPSRDWLLQHGYPAEMANSVEVCNWREFRTLVVTQPACLLHEYAHGWQFTSPGMTLLIKPAYDHAVKTGLYQSVGWVGSPTPVRAYALTNEREFFAELSEAYFAQNDFFPTNRAELKTYDPVGYAMIERVWGVRSAP